MEGTTSNHQLVWVVENSLTIYGGANPLKRRGSFQSPPKKRRVIHDIRRKGRQCKSTQTWPSDFTGRIKGKELVLSSQTTDPPLDQMNPIKTTALDSGSADESCTIADPPLDQNGLAISLVDSFMDISTAMTPSPLVDTSNSITNPTANPPLDQSGHNPTINPTIGIQTDQEPTLSIRLILWEMLASSKLADLPSRVNWFLERFASDLLVFVDLFGEVTALTKKVFLYLWETQEGLSVEDVIRVSDRLEKIFQSRRRDWNSIDPNLWQPFKIPSNSPSKLEILVHYGLCNKVRSSMNL